MTSKIVGKIVTGLIEEQIIRQEDREIYVFGIKAFIMQVVHVAVMILIGIVFSKPLQAIGFVICYSILRTNAGGHHFKSKSVCFATSCLLIILVLNFYPYFQRVVDIGIDKISFMISCGIIWLLAPCDSVNKPMNVKEKRYYSIRTRILLIIVTGVYMMSTYYLWLGTYVIYMSVMIEAIGLLAGTIENRRLRR